MYKVNPRQTRINEEFKKEISALIMNGLKDPRIHPMTTVIETQVTKDLKHCKVFVSVLGNQEAQAETIKGLNSSKGHIRSALAKKINMRNTPELTFVTDQSIEYSIKMSKLIETIKVKSNPDEDLEEDEIDDLEEEQDDDENHDIDDETEEDM